MFSKILWVVRITWPHSPTTRRDESVFFFYTCVCARKHRVDASPYVVEHDEAVQAGESEEVTRVTISVVHDNEAKVAALVQNAAAASEELADAKVRTRCGHPATRPPRHPAPAPALATPPIMTPLAPRSPQPSLRRRLTRMTPPTDSFFTPGFVWSDDDVFNRAFFLLAW